MNADIAEMAVKLATALTTAFPIMVVLSFAVSALALNRLAALDAWLSPSVEKGNNISELDRSPQKVSQTTISAGQMAAPKSWSQQVQAEIWRQLTEGARSDGGIVVVPLPCSDAWYAQSLELKVESSLMLCAETFATLARKELMISGRVVKRKIAITTGCVSADQAFEAFRLAIEAQGIAFVPIGKRTLALVENSKREVTRRAE